MQAEKGQNGGTKPGLVIDGETGAADPTPHKIDLATALDVRREMAIIYRAMKAKTLDSSDGTKLVYVLSQIGKMIEIHEVERRLGELEERIDSGRLLPARTH